MIFNLNTHSHPSHPSHPVFIEFHAKQRGASYRITRVRLKRKTLKVYNSRKSSFISHFVSAAVMNGRVSVALLLNFHLYSDVQKISQTSLDRFGDIETSMFVSAIFNGTELTKL